MIDATKNFREEIEQYNFVTIVINYFSLSSEKVVICYNGLGKITFMGIIASKGPPLFCFTLVDVNQCKLPTYIEVAVRVEQSKTQRILRSSQVTHGVCISITGEVSSGRVWFQRDYHVDLVSCKGIYILAVYCKI